MPALTRSLLVAAALALASQANAVITLTNGQSVNLASLLAPGSDRMVLIEDKVFTFNSFTSSSFAASGVSVVAYVSASTNSFGLRNVGFDLTGSFGDFTPGNGGFAEFNLRYRVEVARSAYANDVRLCDTHLAFNGTASGAGSFARVDETVLDLDSNRYLGNLSAYWIAGQPPQVRAQDVQDFCELYDTHGYRAFEVNKDVKFLAAGTDGMAQATFVRQEFSQVMAPAPGAIAVLALAGTAGRGRRRR